MPNKEKVVNVSIEKVYADIDALGIIIYSWFTSENENLDRGLIKLKQYSAEDKSWTGFTIDSNLDRELIKDILCKIVDDADFEMVDYYDLLDLI